MPSWALMKSTVELAQAFPILEAVFELHHPTESGSCDHCTGEFSVTWPCKTVCVVLDRGGLL